MNTTITAPPPPAITLKRPWPNLILRHGKTVENRVWRPRRRGPMLLHAGAQWDTGGFRHAEDLGIRLPYTSGDHPSGIVGMFDLVDVCSATRQQRQEHLDESACACPREWAIRGHFHWLLANIRPLPEPVPCSGAQGLWYCPPQVWGQVRTQVGM